MKKLLTPPDQFADATSLVLGVLITDAVSDSLVAAPEMEAALIGWFKTNAEQRIRYLHANNDNWRNRLEGKDETVDPRDQVAAFVKHWFMAFRQNPAIYQKRHPLLENPFNVGDKVKLRADVIARHVKSLNLPPSAGFDHNTFQWHATLRSLAGKMGTVSRLFDNSKHTNVDFDSGCIGIDYTELEAV